MRILFDSSLDGRAWPLWPGEKEALLGENRVGRLGLLGLLETILGLRGPDMPEGVRVASLVPLLQQNKQAFWAKSAEVDPFGVARELLRLYDFLFMHGWQEQPLTPRLADLTSLGRMILPAIPQRLVAIQDALSDYEGALPEITLLESEESLPLLWQRLFSRLKEKGAEFLNPAECITEDKQGDLTAARAESFTPIGDCSLQLIRPVGVLLAAEEVAAWLAKVAEEEGLAGTVIIGADPVLDTALNRFGLPVSGATPESGHALLQLLPLVLALGWNPPDPARIMELLTLPVSPIPSKIRRKLIQALSKWPALGSPLWQKNLAEGLSEITDTTERQQKEDRLSILFEPSAVNGEYPVAAIRQRVEMLSRWLHNGFPNDPQVYPALSQCRIFSTMIEALGRENLSEPVLKKIIDETINAIDPPPILPAQAGLAAVTTPEAIIGPARRIVWWNFNRNTVPPLTFPLLTREEQAALASVGVILPDSAILANSRAKRWRRPLVHATEQLVLVCPAQDAAGNDLHPHPLWDELLAASNDRAGSLIEKKIQHSYTLQCISPKQLEIPHALTSWTVPANTITNREKESPSSLENFLGCPLKWCLNYTGKIRGGHSATLPDLVPTLGSLAHEIVEEVLQQLPLPSAEDGAAMAEKIFDAKAKQLVASLFQEGMEAEREKIRNTVIRATRSLLQHLHSAGAGKITVEQKLSGNFGSQKIEGWADVVLDAPFTVIDLKRSWAKGYKEKMTSGTALQIVIYGWLLKEARGVFPELAYYTLEDQTFLTTDSVHFKSGEHVQTPTNDDVWKAFTESYQDTWDTINKGIVTSPGNNGEEIKASLNDGKLQLSPPCHFCEYDTLCGKRFA